jgi:small subunit ribosomal protein S17e
MKSYFSVSLKCWRRKSQCVLGGNYGLGKVRTEHIKRLAKELIRRFPNKFSKDYKSNKQTVNILLRGATPKVKNKVAGYITHIFARIQTLSPNENMEEIE